MFTFWLSMLLLSCLIFMANVSSINFSNIFVSEVILKTRIIKTKRSRTTFLNLNAYQFCNQGSFYLIIMPVDIEQWRAEIWNFNGCCQYPVERFESARLHKISSTVVMSACLFLLILFSNLNTILHFLLLFSVFPFSPSVLEQTNIQNNFFI